MKANTKRIALLDELRGFAIVAMIVHHSFLAIGDVMSSRWGYEMFDRLCVVQPIFWGIFIIISGICTRLSRSPVKRGFIVLGAGLLITLVTAVILPKIGMYNAQIYFGILHCLGCCMIITGLLMPLIEKIKPAWGMLICVALFALTYTVSSGSLLFGLIDLPTALYKTNYLMPLGFYNTSFYSADYFAIFPWIFMFQFGAFFGKYAKDGAFPQWTYKKRLKFFGFVGRNSLWFYLGHQVVIYGILYLIIAISYLISLM